MQIRFSKLTLLILIFLSVFLVACTGGTDAWPAIVGTDSRDTVLVAYKRQVARLNANKEAIWRYTADGSEFYTQPTLVDNTVYIGDYDGKVHAVSYATGERLWIYEPDVTEILFFRFGRRDRVLAPITVAGNLVYFGDEYGVTALRVEDNNPEVAWDFETDHGVWGQPFYLDESTVVDEYCADFVVDWETDWNLDPTLFVVSLDKGMYAIEPQTGEEVWTLELDGAAPGGLTLDCLRQRFYVGTLNKQVLAIDLAEGEIIDRFDTEGWVWGRPVIFEDRDEEERLLYFGDLSGNLYEVVLDASGFSEEAFSRQLSEEPLRATPLVVNDTDTGLPMLVVGSEDKRVYAVELKPGASWIKDRERSIRWSHEYDGRAMTDLTWIDRELDEGVFERLVIVGTDDDNQSVLALRLGDGGSTAWEYEYDN